MIFNEIYFIIFYDIFIVKIRLNDVTKCKYLKLFRHKIIENLND